MLLKEKMINQGEVLFKLRSFLPLLLLVVGIGVFVLRIFEINQHIYLMLKIVGIATAFLGLFIRVTTVGYTPKNTSGRNTTEGQVADSLNTTGWYTMIRHPLYLGNYLMWLGVAIWSASFSFYLMFTLFYWLYYERIILAEEEFLLNKYQQQFIDWTSTTSAFFPKILKWKQPPLSFSWKKVLAKEKNGLFALFTLLYLYDSIYNWMLFGLVRFDGWEFYFFVITGVLYFFLKLLKKQGVFNEEGR